MYKQNHDIFHDNSKMNEGIPIKLSAHVHKVSVTKSAKIGVDIIHVGLLSLKHFGQS